MIQSRLAVTTRWALRRLSLAAVGAVLAATAYGQTDPALYDKPLRVAEVPPKSSDDGRTARCSYYPDVMLREITDGPSATRPALIPGADKPCELSPVAGETVIDLEDMMLDGRKGAFLLFTAMDAHGAADFGVVNAATGAVVFKDASFGDPVFQGIALDGGGVRLRYKRGVNAGCSLMQDPAGCWSGLVKQGLIPKDMANEVPAPQLCDAAYKELQAPRDNPSIVTYDVEMLIAADGAAKPLSRGTVACESQP